MKNDPETTTPYTDATHVDFDTFQVNANRKIEATQVRVFEDVDGHELLEQRFSDGTSVLMHMAQYNAIVLAVARSPHTQAYVLSLEGEELSALR